MPHHSEYDSRTSQHKNYTIEELKDAVGFMRPSEKSNTSVLPAAWMPHREALTLSGLVSELGF
jgi:hypothetical protein